MKHLPLTRGLNAIVDDEDYGYLKQWKWSLSSTGHIVRKHNRKTLLIHRVILNPPQNMVVDHINHNPLDNRRSNLRVCTHHQNMFNSKGRGGISKYKGVSFAAKKWRAHIRYKYKKYAIGVFDTEEEAAIAYNVVAQFIMGDYAYLNDV